MEELTLDDASPEDLLFSVLRDLRGGRSAEDTLVAMATALREASRAAVDAGPQLHLFPDTHLVGFGKYTRMQDAFLLIGRELGLPIGKERHPGPRSSTYFAVLDHPRLYMTLHHVQKHRHNPKLPRFRIGSTQRAARHRADQLPLFSGLRVPVGEQLVAAIVYGYDRTNRVDPAFMEMRYVGTDHYLPLATDLLALRREAAKPQPEPIEEGTTPQLRKKRRREHA